MTRELTAANTPMPAGLAASSVLLEPCPCEGCRFALRCDAEHLACVAFSLLMAGKSAVRRELAARVPTRARYDALLGGACA